MAITITKGLIGVEDLEIQDSTTTTYSRTTSTAGSNTLTRLSRGTLNTREYDVTQYGAVGNGISDDTAAIQAVITACAVSGGTVVFPPGYTFAVKPTAADTAIFTVSPAKPMTFLMYGAEMRVLSSSSLDPTSAANEKTHGAIFRSVGVSGLTFLGGTIDLNRDYADGDPRYSFFHGAFCNYTTFRDITFKDCSNYHGAIFMTDVNGSALSRWHSLTIDGCHFYKSSLGISLEGAMRNVTISNNKFSHMDLAIYRSATTLYGIDDGYGAGTYKPARCIKIQAFGNGADTATDTINGGTLGIAEGISITGNTVYGTSQAIEITAGNSVDNLKFRGITVTGNTMFGLSGILARTCSGAVISGNTFRRLDSTDISTYDDTAYVNGITSGSFLTDVKEGWGVDVRKCRDVHVTGNVIDGGYAFSAQENDVDGITFGENTDDVTVNAHVEGNTIRQCRYGMLVEQCSRSIVRDNRITNSQYAFATDWSITDTAARNTTNSYNDNVLSGNYFLADPSEHSAAGNSLLLVRVEGSWQIKDNTFVGRLATGTDLRLLRLYGFNLAGDSQLADEADITLKNNVFRRFQYTPVELDGGFGRDEYQVVRLSMTGNEFYSEKDTLPAITVGCVHINRPSNGQALAVSGGFNYASNLRRAFTMDYPSLNGGTEVYNFGTWDHDQNSDSTNTWALYEESETNSAGTGYAGYWRANRGVMVKQMQVRCNTTTGVVSVTDFLPYGIILHVSVRNEEVLTMGSSGTGYYVGWGTGSTAVLDRYWGSVDALTDDTSNNAEVINHPTTPLLRGISSTQNELILSAKLSTGALGGTFTDGDVLVTCYYIPANASEF